MRKGSFVKGKNSFFSSQVVPTIFVDNLPIQIRKIWVYNLFSRFGKIKDIYIPFKKSKVTGRKFGFVRFSNSEDASLAISRVDKSWRWDHLLVVKYARFLKNQDRHVYNQQFYGRKDQRNFAEGMNQVGNNRTQGQRLHATFAVPERNLQFLNSGGLEKRGEEVWRRKGTAETSKKGEERNKTLEDPKNHPRMESINIHSSGTGWLLRSAVAKLRRIVSVQYLLEMFSKKVDNIQIKSMGGRFLIITFLSDKVRDEVIKEKWLEYWFEELKPWTDEPAQIERFVWLGCYGMPLNVWNLSTFRTIGSRWGHFLEVDDNTLREVSFEKARLLVVTDETNKIEGQVHLNVNGKGYWIRVEEEESFRTVSPSIQLSCSGSESKVEDDEVDESFKLKDYVAEKVQSCNDKDVTKNDLDDSEIKSNERVEDTLEMEDQLPKGMNSNCEINENYSYANALIRTEETRQSFQPTKVAQAFTTTLETDEDNKGSSQNSSGMDNQQEHCSNNETDYESSNDEEREDTVVDQILNQPVVIGEENDIRVSQLKGLNLLVDLRPAQVRKIRRSQSLQETSCDQGGINSQIRNKIANELRSTIEAGTKWGVDFGERDIKAMENLIKSENHLLLQRNSSDPNLD